MQINQDSYRMGVSMYDAALARQRQEEMDALTKKEFGWREAENTDRVAQRTDLDLAFKAGLEAARSGNGAEQGDTGVAKFLSQWGLDGSKPQQPSAQPTNPATDNVVVQAQPDQPVGSFAGDPAKIMAGIQAIKDPVERKRAAEAFSFQMNKPQENSAGVMAARGLSPLVAEAPQVQSVPMVQAGQMEPAQPVVQQQPMATPAQPQGDKTDPRRAMLITSMEMAKAKRDTAAFQQAATQLQEMDKQGQYAKLVERAQNMSPQERAAVVGRMSTDNNGYRMKAVVDPQSQLTRLEYETDDGGARTVNMSQSTLAKFLVGQYKIQNGDMSGLADIEAIDKGLADRVKADNDSLRQMTTANNDVTAKADHMRLAQTQVNQAGQARVDARNDKNTARADVEAKAKAAMAIYQENNPGATPAQLEAVRTGVMAAIPGAGDKNDPSDVKLARSALAAKVPGVTDMASALLWARNKSTKPAGEMHAEFVASSLKNYGSPADAVQKADEVMAKMGYVKSGGTWALPGGNSGGPRESSGRVTLPAGVPEAGKRTVGQTYDTPRGPMVWKGNGWEPAN